MDQARADQLESLPGWSWDPLADTWEANYCAIVEYVAQHKRIPPQSHPTLGNWVHTQRKAYKAWQARLHGETEKYKGVKEYMDQAGARKLELVPGWKWDMHG